MANKKINITEEIGHKIKFMRNMRNISSVDMANTLGVSRQQLQNYESGEADIKVDRLYEIAKALDVNINFFFDGFCDASGNNDVINILENINHIKDVKIKEIVCGLIKELSQN